MTQRWYSILDLRIEKVWKKEKNLKAFLFTLFFILLFIPGASSLDITSSNYTDTGICAGCHPDIYKQWQGSMHSNSEKDPFYKKIFLLASEKTDGLVDTFCPCCRAPVGFVSGEIPPADGSNLSLIATKGLICDFCHTISGYTAESNGQYIPSPGNVKRGALKDPNSPYHESAYSELHTKAEFCGYCHDIDHPVSGPCL